MRKGQQTFFVEITDTFGGEPNYSYVVRHKVVAKSPRGAITKINRVGGVRFKREYDYGEFSRYNSESGSTCAFIEHWDEPLHSGLNNVKTELAV